MPIDPKTITLEDKLKEVEREIALRHRVYKGLVARKKIRQEAADKQIATMIAIRNDYQEKIKQGPLFRTGEGL
jgi:hypothetical protein